MTAQFHTLQVADQLDEDELDAKWASVPRLPDSILDSSWPTPWYVRLLDIIFRRA